MTLLDIYYFSGDNRADEPVTVNSETALDGVSTGTCAPRSPKKPLCR